MYDDENPGIVDTDLAAFAEFLLRVVETDDRRSTEEPGRTEAGKELRAYLAALDPAPFADDASSFRDDLLHDFTEGVRP
ncbi:SUKH-4 family immunity protein [Embleya sp. NPDC005971]|uniref:SUKH-4 family immunity protein n=1 Tax=Embleya sp. NPDC005971 TaxID=3156724 RepID=UPI003404EC4E